MAIDWKEQRVTHELEARMVSPQNPGSVLGVLEGIDWSGSSLSAAYYTDTRTSGKLAVVDSNWVRGSFVQIVHRIPEHGYENVMGTYLARSDDAVRGNGAWVTTLDLQSMLYALSTDIAVSPWTVQRNAYCKTAMKQMLNGCKRPYVDRSAKDRRIGTATVLPTGESCLKRLFTLCDMTGNRLDVDGQGRVVLAPYVLPARKSPAMRIDLADSRGTVVQDSLSRTTDWLAMPGRVGVCYRYTESQEYKEKGQTKTRSVEREIRAHVDATGHASSKSRGYMVTDYHQLTELEPKTAANAQKIARQKMAAAAREKVEWELSTTFLPLWEGDVVELAVSDGEAAYQGVRKCLVKNVEVELGHMTMKLTLKETASGDEED